MKATFKERGVVLGEVVVLVRWKLYLEKVEIG